jgi:hypothetical protein
MKHILCIIVCLVLVICLPAEDVVLKNNSGVELIISKTNQGYTLGKALFNGKPVEAPLLKGIINFRNISTDSTYWFFGSEINQVNPTKAILSGTGDIEGAMVEFEVELETPDDAQALRIIYDFTVDHTIPDRRAVLQFNSQFDYDWNCHMYPWVEDSKWIARDTLTWMGIPSLFMYRDDRSMGLLWGIDPNSDYLNPETWTKNFGLYFTNRVKPAQFQVGGGSLKKGIDYHCPMQIVFTDRSDPDELIIDLMQNWIALNEYKVEPLYVRSNDEALALFIKGRKENPGVYNPGKGYGLHGNRDLRTFLYMGVQGMAAYFDYMLYEFTGDPLWRERAFEQMDFVLEGQNNDKNSLNYGAVHTSYTLSPEYAKGYGPSPAGWCSDDRWNIGYKPDICALNARYMLKMWQLLKNHEGIDRQDWYNSAVKQVEFIMRQKNNDGGLPQKVQIEPLEMRWHEPWGNLLATPIKYRSATSGRALPAFGHLYKITGDERYKTFMKQLEEYHLYAVQNQYYYTSHHPDLPPWELEEASIWGVCEYWLDRYEETKNQEFLDHARANVYLAMTWWVPKQLSWVKNPTQCGAAEQQHYLSLVVYCYQNRKIECLKRLYDYTQEPLFGQLYDRNVQNIYWTQQTTKNGHIGGTYERTSLPWEQGPEYDDEFDYNSVGVWYFNEQALDAIVQIFEMYRTGQERIYLDENLITKVYPDAVCYYNKDISGLKEIPFMVIPSTGTLKLSVNNWSTDKREWTVDDVSGSQVTLDVSMGDLNDNIWFKVSMNGEELGDYQSNERGELYFTVDGSFPGKTSFVMVKKS